MEPISSAAIATATLIFTKAFEKTGEKLGEAVSQQVSKLLQLVRRKPLPQTVAIEKADQPVDFGKAVLELESATATDVELAESVNQLAALVQADPKLSEAIAIYARTLQNAQPATVQTFGKLAENIQEIKAVFQGNTFNQSTFNF